MQLVFDFRRSLFDYFSDRYHSLSVRVFIAILIVLAAALLAASSLPENKITIEKFYSLPAAELPPAPEPPPAPVPVPVPVLAPAPLPPSPPPPLLPVKISTPPPAVIVSLPEQPINLRTVVVLRCTFVNSQGEKRRAFGSGAIISPQGHILTARHVFDLDYAYQITAGRQGAKDYQLENCQVGQPPPGTNTPTPAEIRAINPFTTVQVFGYEAEQFFVVNNTSDWSAAEEQFFDLGVLKITGLTSDAQYFGITIPAAFEFSPLLADQVPGDGEEIITFGFPSGNPQYGGQFYLQGSVGKTTAIIVGDQKFKDQPLGLQAQMETIAGRSGSPVFWRGSVIGIVSAKEDYSINSTSISVVPLMKFLTIGS